MWYSWHLDVSSFKDLGSIRSDNGEYADHWAFAAPKVQKMIGSKNDWFLQVR